MRIGTHAAGSPGGQRLQFGPQGAVSVEQFGRPVTLQPLFQLGQVPRRPDVAQRYLVRPPEAFHALAVDGFGAGPALGGTQHDHRPARPYRHAAGTRFLLDAADFQHAGFHGGCHRLVHDFRIMAFDETGRPAITLEQVFQLIMGDPRQDGGIVDLVAVEVQDRQHGTVRDRVEELVGMP
ncbi:hypothetical protein GALL_486270 [mine drainage metagenome]|uniref:Uncharacterized protein n=1 Tax=mine drainage metagenome TaxID=410659 RepID=A0A1J5PEW9_9ZZZZ